MFLRTSFIARVHNLRDIHRNRTHPLHFNQKGNHDFMKLFRELGLGAAILMAATVTSPAKVVINEIFYHAPDDILDLEWIEIYNTADRQIDLSGWQFNRGIKFSFPAGSKIESGGFAVLVKDVDLYLEYYDTAPLGSYSGTLSNSGESLELVDSNGASIDTVTYTDSTPWPVAPDGYSASLERIFPGGESNAPSNWAPSKLNETEPKPGGSPGAKNSSDSTTTPPMVSIEAGQFEPAKPTSVNVSIEQGVGVDTVELGYQLVGPGNIGSEKLVTMKRDGSRYQANIPGQEGGSLVRYRVRTIDGSGNESFYPHKHSLRPAFTGYVVGNIDADNVPLAFIINPNPADMAKMNRVLETAQKIGNSPWNNRDQFMAWQQIDAQLDFAKAWYELSIAGDMSGDALAKSQRAFITANQRKKQLFNEVDNGNYGAAGEVRKVRDELKKTLTPVLSAEQLKKLDAGPAQGGRGRARTPRQFIENSLPLEKDWYELNVHFQPSGNDFDKLRALFVDAERKRDQLFETLQNRPNQQEVMGRVDSIRSDLNDGLGFRQRRYLIDLENSIGSFIRPNFGGVQSEPPRGRSAFVVVDPGEKGAEVFDFVNVSKRSAGYKVRLHKDKAYRDMNTLNIIFEYNDRFVLAEPLAFDIYERVGSPACQTEFVRLQMNDKPGGYHLMFEHINGSYLRRNNIETGGDLYKILWYGSGIVGQHQRKGDPEGGHEELIEVVERLNQTSGDEQWNVIEENFDVDQVAKYFAVNMVLSHWDGYFNNYFTYRNPETGKWQMYAWDQDKTWGYFDSLGEHVDFTFMPITFGMNGDPRPQGGGNFGRSWWRPGGHFSGPMLANPQFRKLFLTETKRILQEIYTEDNYYPVIDELAESLRPEIAVRAKIVGESESDALARFDANIASLKRHLKKRREFLLAQDELKNL